MGARNIQGLPLQFAMDDKYNNPAMKHTPPHSGEKEDFAVLGQFCAKIITWGLYSYTKCSCKTKRKISNEFYQQELTIIFSWMIFDDSIKS